MRPFSLIAAALFAPISVPAAALAQGADASAETELAHKSEQLRAGEWVWAPDFSPEGPVNIVIDLTRQIASVYRNGVRIGVSTISSGKRRYETPTGVFTILQKARYHRSNKYNNAPMPFMQRLTWDGVAMHAGVVREHPASHGCVRLPREFAEKLFQITSMGGAVVITGEAGAPWEDDAAGLLTPIDTSGSNLTYPPLGEAAYRWTPNAAPFGPMTIVMSRASQEVVVFRNAIEIGRARADIPIDDSATHVLTMTRDAMARPRWVYVDAANDNAPPLDTPVMERIRMPLPFSESLEAELEPGATLVVTPAKVDGQSPPESAGLAPKSFGTVAGSSALR